MGVFCLKKLYYNWSKNGQNLQGGLWVGKDPNGKWKISLIFFIYFFELSLIYSPCVAPQLLLHLVETVGVCCNQSASSSLFFPLCSLWLLCLPCSDCSEAWSGSLKQRKVICPLQSQESSQPAKKFYLLFFFICLENLKCLFFIPLHPQVIILIGVVGINLVKACVNIFAVT